MGNNTGQLGRHGDQKRFFTLIEAALRYTSGRKRDASLVLGWGRNTLTRKMNELGMNGAEQD